MIGKKMPPALAVVLGIAGATTASAAARPYARPKVELPKALTKSVATLSPSPVFWKPAAKKNDTTMSQMTSLRKAEKACAKLSAPEATAAVAATAAQAPVGSGSSTKPAIVDTKTESKVQAWGSSPAGMGTRKRRARPMPTEAARGRSLAPFCFGGGESAALAGAAAAPPSEGGEAAGGEDSSWWCCCSSTFGC